MKGKVTHVAVVVGGMMVTGAVMASSLVLPSAQSLAGQWLVANAEQQCQIEFLAGEQSEINGYSLVDRQHCLEKVLTAEVVGWRPAPDASLCCGRMAVRWRSSRAMAIFTATSLARMTD